MKRWGLDIMILVFECWVLSQLFHSLLSLSSRLFSSSSFSVIRVVSSAYLKLLIFLPAILIPACASSSPAFLMMYSAYKLNKQDNNIQPWCTPFPTSLLFHVQFCFFLTCIQISQEAGQVVWYFHLFKNFPVFVVVHTVKAFGIVNKAEVDVFLEFSCFSDDQMDIGILISGSSAFLKSRLNIWKFMVHILLKSVLENFEHYFASVWDEWKCVLVWAFFGIAFLWDWNENWHFQSCGHYWVYQICWNIECSTFTVSSFRIWNSSTGIPSPTLALFVVMLSKAHLTSHSRMSGSRWVINHREYQYWLLGWL